MNSSADRLATWPSDHIVSPKLQGGGVHGFGRGRETAAMFDCTGTPMPTLNDQSAGLPADLAAVALIDAKTSAAVGSMKTSWWHAEVAAGRAPQPVLRAHRCTRWRMADVREFWDKLAQTGRVGADDVVARAKKASEAAQAKRAQSTQLGA